MNCFKAIFIFQKVFNFIVLFKGEDNLKTLKVSIFIVSFYFL